MLNICFQFNPGGAPDAGRTYLIFNSVCEEALASYQQALGARAAMMMCCRESPGPCPEDEAPAQRAFTAPVPC